MITDYPTRPAAKPMAAALLPATAEKPWLRLPASSILCGALIALAMLALGAPQNPQEMQPLSRLQEPPQFRPQVSQLAAHTVALQPESTARPRYARAIDKRADKPLEIPGFRRTYLRTGAYGASVGLALRWVASCSPAAAESDRAAVDAKELLITVESIDGQGPLPQPISSTVAAADFRAGTVLALNLPLLSELRMLGLSACPAAAGRRQCAQTARLLFVPLVLSGANLYVPKSADPAAGYAALAEFLRERSKIGGSPLPLPRREFAQKPAFTAVLKPGPGVVTALLPLQTPECTAGKRAAAGGLR